VISKAILKEISLVIFPANPLAAVTAVKQAEDAPPLAALLPGL
jgi:phage head maturation protease